ncbi:MAG TPA: glycosyltransferase, partial [Gaiellaceae bacterium]|nr:glycosyltransferase [Gaiellaceae bacterium]
HREHGLDGIVDLVGAAPQHDVLAWWQRASIAALSSAREGAPVCLMEAAACGVPAVAPAVGGVAELIEHGSTGFVTRPGDPEGLAEALERLLTDAVLRERLGVAARRRAEERFSVALQVDRLLDVWDGVLHA